MGKKKRTESTEKSHENVNLWSNNDRQVTPPLDFDVKHWTEEDIKWRDDNFATPWGKLAEAELPMVDGGIRKYSIKSIPSGNNVKIPF